MPVRSSLAAIPVASAFVLAACGSGPALRHEAGAAVATRAPSSTPAASTPATRRSGGYYLDDGPGDNPPPNLDLLPDAIPRVEKYASGANRPYNVFGVDYVPDLSGAPYRQRGVGSWYGRKFHGQRTSSGELYDMYAMTAAHPTLPIPCYALVTNVANGRSVIVRVNDRGPFLHNRVMDLSYAAALKLGYLSSGSGLIEVEMLRPVDIAAGRIPVTTTSLLLASMPPGASQGATASAAAAASNVSTNAGAAAPSMPSAGITAIAGLAQPAAASATGLTIEALTARAPDAVDDATGPRLPAAPAVVSNASTPLPGSIVASPTAPTASAGSSIAATTPTRTASDVLALPDRQPPAELPETSTRAGFFLQLGAFRSKAGADSFASHLSRLIDPALASRVQVSDANGLYRVRVGPYPERAAADVAAASVKAVIAQPVLVMPDGVAR